MEVPALECPCAAYRAAGVPGGNRQPRRRRLMKPQHWFMGIIGLGTDLLLLSPMVGNFGSFWGRTP